MIEKKLTFIARMKDSSIYLNKFNVDLKNNIFNDDYEVIDNNKNKIRIINYKVNDKLYHIGTNLLDKDKYKLSFLKILIKEIRVNII